MDSLEVKRPVIVKVIMTSDFRKALLDEATETIKRIDETLKSFEGSEEPANPSTIETDPEKDAATKARIEQEKDRLFQMKSALMWKMKEVDNVDDGAELPYQVLEGMVTVKVGDDILERMAKTEIVIKDWKVVEIRNA